ncbi:archease [Candidatus Woesearchaeota archaeon]|nr:archease [Candidatus Woesearchaeota archaeon]
MKKFEFIDHTADAKFIAYGKDIEEAFTNAALAFITLVTDIHKVKPKQEKTIEIAAEKKQSLLFDFLEELIYLMDTEGFLLHDIPELKIEKKDKYTLKARVRGDAGDYEILTQIKAMTYSDMFIKETEGKVEIQVVPDI